VSKSRSRLIVCLAACGVIASLTAAPASAANDSRATPSLSAAPATQVSPLVKSRYLAGYRATDPDHVSGVIIKAVDVPDVNCADKQFEGVAVGGGSEPVLGRREYFAGVLLTCVSGQAQYLMEVTTGDGQEQGTGIEPGDQAQIVISIQCDAYPTCDVFASATSLDTDASVSVTATLELTTNSAVFGAFPLFADGSSRPAPVPDFGRARLRGCVFGNSLLGKGAERLVRVHHGTAQIRPTRIDVGSFSLKHVG
jgi:hypothetical protein